MRPSFDPAVHLLTRTIRYASLTITGRRPYRRGAAARHQKGRAALHAAGRVPAARSGVGGGGDGRDSAASDGLHCCASSRLDDLVRFIDALGQKTTVPGEAGFEEWLASEIKKAVVCDSFCALWHNEESKTLKDTLKGHEIGVAPAGEEAKQQSTGHITAQQEQGAERYIQSANADRRTIYHVGPPTSHLCIPVISHIRPGAAAYGVLHLEGSNTRSEALGTTAFYKNERRFVEDLASHLGLFMDAQSVAMGGAAAMSHRSSV